MEVSQEKIIKALNEGEVIGIPTDTVYGFATLEEYQDNIYILKKRHKNKKLIKFINSVDQIENTLEFTKNEIKQIAKDYWPGSNTLIFQTHEELASYRIPNEPNVLNLLGKLNGILVTTSANISGQTPCVTSEDFINKFPNIKLLKEEIKSDKSKVPSSIFIVKKNGIKKIR